jgi:hypothetical protein
MFTDPMSAISDSVRALGPPGPVQTSHSVQDTRGSTSISSKEWEQRCESVEISSHDLNMLVMNFLATEVRAGILALWHV